MRNIITHMSFSKHWFVALIAVTVISMTGFLLSTLQTNAAADVPANQHLLTVHDGTTTRGIMTKAATLDEALTQAGLTVADQDRVEPELDTELVASNYDINIYRALPVTVKDGGVQKRIMSPYRVAEQIAENAHMSMHDEDSATLSSSSAVNSGSPGLVLTIDRATPFTLVLYGKTVTAYSKAKTVGEMLEQKNITLGKKDTLSVKKDASLKKGMRVEIWRNGKQTTTREEVIKYGTKTIEDADRPTDYRKVKTPGKNGKKMVTYEITMKNGKKVHEKAIQTVETTQPKDEVVVVGTKMSNSFDGDFAGALAKLRSCEGSYTSNTGNGYYGAYQYDIGTWGGYKGYSNAAEAPPKVQDEKAWQTYKARGWSPWPSCSVSQGLQDKYR